MIVVDTNVVLSGMRSSLGASHQIVRGMIEGSVSFAVSPAIALEYEDVLKRRGILGKASPVSEAEIDIVLDTIFGEAVLIDPWFRLRPVLNDPKDDIYVECAVAAGAEIIVTNDRDFSRPALRLWGLKARSPGAFMVTIRRRSETK